MTCNNLNAGGNWLHFPTYLEETQLDRSGRKGNGLSYLKAQSMIGILRELPLSYVTNNQNSFEFR